MDLTFEVGTDIATFYLYDPTLLHHREQDPLGWEHEESIPEYADGRLVQFPALLTWDTMPVDPNGPPFATSIGSDGLYRIHCTTDAVTPAEAQIENTHLRRAVQIRIASGIVHLDGGYALPWNRAESPAAPPSDVDTVMGFGGLARFHLAPGAYAIQIRYLVHADDLGDEHVDEENGVEANLPHIVVTFRPVS